MSNPSCFKEVLETLGKQLQDNMPSLAKVIYAFPSANVSLQYPSISIILTRPEFLPIQREIFEQSDISDDFKSEVKYINGEYDLALQLDLWCRDKVERFALYEELMDALNPNSELKGLSLKLEKYHGVYCRYDMIDMLFSDNEGASQRAEWRLTVNVLANTRSIKAESEYMIDTIENNLTLPDTIP